MRWIVRVAVLALLAVVATKVRARQAELATVAEDLDVGREGIVHTEAYVDDLDARIDAVADRARDLDGRLSEIDARYPSGIPAAARAEYDRLLTRRNEAVAEQNHLTARRQSAVREYEDGVARHNTHIESANALADESTPWRILRGLWGRVAGHPTEEQ